MLEAGVTPDNGKTYEHLIGTKEGGSLFDDNGHRHSAADLLSYANPNNLDVLIWASVQKILFKGKILKNINQFQSITKQVLSLFKH